MLLLYDVIFLFFVFLVSTVSALEEINIAFEEFLKEWQISYPDHIEYRKRQSIFEANKQRIVKHNQHRHASEHILRENRWMDRMDTDLSAGLQKLLHPAWNEDHPLHCSFLDSSNLHVKDNLLSIEMSPIKDLPKHVDWRFQAGRITATAVKQQGECGSCWAFATTATLESYLAIETGTLLSLSPQELVSCSSNGRHCGGEGGCTGSTAEIAFDFVRDHGIVTEWEFGYQSYHNENITCILAPSHGEKSLYSSQALDVDRFLRHRRNQAIDQSWNPLGDAVATVDSYVHVPTNNYTAMMNAIAKVGPVVVNVACNNWQFYGSGVFVDHGHSEDRTDINHVVVLMGYGTDPDTKQDYWLIRNSWGPFWGEDGYIRLLRQDPTTLVSPEADCGMDLHAPKGIACTRDENGNTISPPPVKVCGTSGILFDGVIPLGVKLLAQEKD